MGVVAKYRLVVAPSLNRFRNEIIYAFNYINRHYGMEIDEGSTRLIRYGGPDASMPATFFESYVCIKTDGLSVRKNKKHLLTKLWPRRMRFSESEVTEIDYIGLIFFMLSRIEERDPREVDKHERFISSSSFSHQNNWLDRPLVDECAQIIASFIAGKPLKPVSKFRVVLTHDVDKLRGYHYFAEPARYFLGDFLKRKKGVSSLKRLQAYISGEPWASVNSLMHLSDQYGVKSNFFFMGPSADSMDSPYAITMRPLLKRVVDHIINRGHMVGFHPGYQTFKDSKNFCEQKNSLELLTKTTFIQGRQHVIRYDCAATPRIWSESGMQSDFTLFYPDAIGFRNGSCRPYNSFDLINRRVLSIEQTATAIAEFSLLDERYNKFSLSEALALCEPIIKSVRKHQGDLVILFHTHQLKTIKFDFYQKLLAKVAC